MTETKRLLPLARLASWKYRVIADIRDFMVHVATDDEAAIGNLFPFEGRNNHLEALMGKGLIRLDESTGTPRLNIT